MMYLGIVALISVVAGGVAIGGLSNRRRGGRRLALLAVGGALVGVSVATLLAASHSVPNESVGLVYTFGKITGQTGPGFQMVAPWTTLKTVSVQVRGLSVDMSGTNSAFSKETAEVFVHITVNYQVSPECVQDLYTKVGEDWPRILMETRVRNFMKGETVKYALTDIEVNRETIRTAVRDRLIDDLKPFSVTVIEVLLDNTDYPSSFRQSVEAKQVAAQQALAAQAKVAQVEVEARQTVAQAKRQADAEIERARGQAEATRLRGEALRTNPDVLKSDFIAALKDGKAQVIYLPSSELTQFLPLPTPAPTAAR